MKPSDTTSYKLHAIVFIMDHIAKTYIKQISKISFEQFLTMLCIYENPWHTQKFVADWLKLTEATLSYMINKLLQLEYVVVTTSNEDKRIKQLNLTTKWKKEIESIYPHLEEKMKNMFGWIWEDNLESFEKNVDSIFKMLIKNCNYKCNKN